LLKGTFPRTALPPPGNIVPGARGQEGELPEFAPTPFICSGYQGDPRLLNLSIIRFSFVSAVSPSGVFGSRCSRTALPPPGKIVPDAIGHEGELPEFAPTPFICSGYQGDLRPSNLSIIRFSFVSAVSPSGYLAPDFQGQQHFRLQVRSSQTP
jgi:hypothetical protein